MDAVVDSQRLEELLEDMDIPFNRKYINLNNLKWLHKHLGARNSNNPHFDEAMNLIDQAIKHKNYKY